MHTFTETTFISEFSIQPNGMISVRKTTEVRKDGVIISTTYWRGGLSLDDPNAEAVLGDEPYYLDLARHAWGGATRAPVVEPAPASTPVVEPETHSVSDEPEVPVEPVAPE